MAYTLEKQYSLDIDWFFKDSENNICHVASGGGRLPDLIANSEENNIYIGRFIRGLAPLFEVDINAQLFQIVDIPVNRRSLYLRDFTYFASRGFYSFDNSKLGLFENNLYHLVAKPQFRYGMSNESLPVDLYKRIPTINCKLDLDSNNSFELFD